MGVLQTENRAKRQAVLLVRYKVIIGRKKHNVKKTIPLIQKYADNKTISGIIRLLE